MDWHILNKKGLSILEVTVVMAIIGTLILMVIATAKARVDRAKLEKTVNDMLAIAQASLDYYNSQRAWPGTPSDLVPTYMNASVALSPFGGNYTILPLSSLMNNAVTVSTTVPSGLAKNFYQGTILQTSSGPQAGQDTVQITEQIPNEFPGRLEYEKAHPWQ